MATRFGRVATPIGSLLVVADSDAVLEIFFEKGTRRASIDKDWEEGGRIVRKAVKQLTEFFSGKRHEFDLPVNPGGTDFQRRVWKELQRIPYGRTLSYAEVARRIGRPKAVRAVGAANGKNPIPIVIPCHRVIGKDGSLTGFGGGIDVKEKLLNLEGAKGMRPLPFS